jgi:site-specific DNA-adenine methylase
MSTDLKASFPWFGGKSKVAPLVWERFGDVQNYVEPFFGSGAVLLGRPTEAEIETVNDLDCMVANFWRALQNDPDAVADAADWPVNEADQHARHLWLCSQEEFRERMKVDPEYYDAKIAGWWVWGQCIWIGSGWCSAQLPHLGNAGRGVNRQLPHLGDAGTGVHRKLPHLGDAGTGVHRKLPHLGDAGEETPSRVFLQGYMRELAVRLRRVRIACGDWERVCTPTSLVRFGVCGVFLDPPYTDGDMDYAAGGVGGDVSAAVREWAVSNGDNPLLRIALCGYEGEHKMPESWECVAWKAKGGYATSQENAAKERIWFSPYCLQGNQRVFDFT